MFISLLGRRRAGLSCTRTIERGRSGQVLRGGGMEGNPTPELAVGIPDELGEAVVDASASADAELCLAARGGGEVACRWDGSRGACHSYAQSILSPMCPVRTRTSSRWFNRLNHIDLRLR